MALTAVSCRPVQNDTVGEEISGPKFKFLIFREDCFEKLTQGGFTEGDCVGMTISKILGYLIILGSMTVKLPQILSIMNAKNGDGILASMFYAENILLMMNGLYAIHIGSPFSVYGENFIILIQNIIILLLLWTYQKDISLLTKILVTVFEASLFTVMYLDIVGEQGWLVLMNSQLLIVSYSRIPQIMHSFRQGSTGKLSIITFCMNAAGNCARLFTMMKEANDILLMMTAFASFIFNFTILVQIIILGDKGTKTEQVTSAPPKKLASKPSSRGKKKID
ncbi:unnamed protein product [Moneuplotes crassus]|uniref:Mannose-P-dolichol utilization defect 1 protein homolog n=1 Tax=Euplotes crassus TaxID=5936 RepID=A0AAD2D204_EUPCR|nr:unnamed protein product [Moneuplotes crassus]